MKRMTLNIDLEDNEVFEQQIKEIIKAEVKGIVRRETERFVIIESEKEAKRIIGDASYYNSLVRRIIRDEVQDNIRGMLIANKMNDHIGAAFEKILENAVISGKVERICNTVINERISKIVAEKLKELLEV